MPDQSLLALAEIRRHQIVAAWFNPATRSLYNDAHVYAIRKGIYPLLHEEVLSTMAADSIRTVFPFFDTYQVSYDIVDEIWNLFAAAIDAADEAADSGNTPPNFTYRTLEDKYRASWSGNDLRSDLVHICRYFFLYGQVGDESFWKSFMKNCPVEAKQIIYELKPEEISFL